MHAMTDSDTSTQPMQPVQHRVGLTARDRRQAHQRTRIFGASAALALLALVAAVVTQRPEALCLGAPFFVAIALATVGSDEHDLDVAMWVASTRVVEGDAVTVSLDLTSNSGIDRLEVELVVNSILVPVSPLRTISAVPAASTKRLAVELHAAQWGIAKVEGLHLRAVDRLGLFSRTFDFSTDLAVHVGMSDERVEAPMRADRFRRIVGSHLSPDRGQGVEIADVRPWQSGDAYQDINWRITNRQREPWVTLRHPDRSTNLVVIVDAHEGDGAIENLTQRTSVSAALAIARAHLTRHDRVGLLIVGHTVQWLAPQLGRNHLFAMADALVAVGAPPEASLRLYRPVAVNTIASDTIVVAITPLLDPRMANLLAELRSRGNPVSVLVPQADRATSRERAGWSADAEARRLAAIEHDAVRCLLADRGVAMIDWPPAASVAAIVSSLERLRRTISQARSA